MASFDVAFEWMMNFEDPHRAYAVVPDIAGSSAISGINSSSFPAAYVYIESKPQSERAAAVHIFYQDNLWNQYIEKIESDDVAKRLFDAMVNMGTKEAVKQMQRACNAVVFNWMPRDGIMGVMSLTSINVCKPDALVSAFRNVRIEFYKDITMKNPSNEKYLAGWISRAQA